MKTWRSLWLQVPPRKCPFQHVETFLLEMLVIARVMTGKTILATDHGILRDQ